jgi:hypothetical protein
MCLPLHHTTHWPDWDVHSNLLTKGGSGLEAEHSPLICITDLCQARLSFTVHLCGAMHASGNLAIGVGYKVCDRTS